MCAAMWVPGVQLRGGPEALSHLSSYPAQSRAWTAGFYDNSFPAGFPKVKGTAIVITVTAAGDGIHAECPPL